jgi:hypothetical protein
MNGLHRVASHSSRILIVALATSIASGAALGAAPPPAARQPRTPPEGFPTGPAIGERVPGFRLPNQRGVEIDFDVDRAGRKAVVLFQRSAVW